ncbi:MAG: multicopper oxidase domain-containing protein, partial [Gammaproteobacteria bacterium]|nr:multicopper oxidase domain-containing protein [Gammaproteobacteria bacterium]
HPVHIHFEEGIIIRRNGEEPPEWEKWARKDMYRIGPQPDSGDVVEVALRFREFAGTYMEHCHNTQHEDHAMLMRYDIEHPGQVKLMPTPIPSWDRVTYVDSVALPTVREGDGDGEFGPDLDDEAVEIWLDGMVVEQMDMVGMEIGDAVNPSVDERAVGKIPLMQGINVDSLGNEGVVYFVLHEISDEELAEEMGIIWAGGLNGTPFAATADATFINGDWTFFGDLPNPIHFGPGHAALNAGLPPQSMGNTYSPLRSVNLNGKDVLVNAF